MDHSQLRQHRWRNSLQTLLLVAGMALLCAAVAWMLGGMPFAVAAVFAVGMGYLLNPALSPAVLARLYGAQEVGAREAPELVQLVALLARRAEIHPPPRLFYIPSDVLNAFTTGRGSEAVVAISDGLLRRLELREIAGVLAHELTHIRHDDTRVMALADLFSRMTALFGNAGLMLLFLNLPLSILGAPLPWGPVLLLVLAPNLVALLQLALSRTREYDADLGAAELTGDPEGLASALAKMNAISGNPLERIFLPGRRMPDPSLLRTHPPTEERVRRLLELRGRSDWRHPPPADLPFSMHLLAPRPLTPRRRWHGHWY